MINSPAVLPENLSFGDLDRERPPVNGTSSQLCHRAPVNLRAVALVPGKPVAGILFRITAHQVIPSSLGEDGCSRNANAALISLDERCLGDLDFGQDQVVGEKVIRKMRR